jgi:hypothetical protein
LLINNKNNSNNKNKNKISCEKSPRYSWNIVESGVKHHKPNYFQGKKNTT